MSNTSGRWLDVFAGFARSPLFRKLLRDVLLAGLYAAGAVWIERRNREFDLPLGPEILSMLGIILGLVLVFRTNTSYDRWWEGRKAWGQLVNISRSLARQLDAMLGQREDTRPRRERYVALLTRYPVALMEHLRATHPLERHVPNELLSEMVRDVHADIAADRLPREAIKSLTPLLTAFDDVCGACERIRRTPIPYAYGAYVKMFILLYALVIPFALAERFGYGAVFAEMFIFFSCMGLELIANEVAEPFGTTRNDLPLEGLSATIARDVRAALPA
jgi:putative membrane protein